MDANRQINDAHGQEYDNNRTVLILDYDGTLHQSSIVYESAFRKAMDDIAGRGWIPRENYTSEEINYWIGFSAHEMWEKFHPELSDEQKKYAGRLVGDYMMAEIREGKAKLYPGALKALMLLKKDYELIFFSNCRHEYADAHRKAFGLDRWIDDYFCTGDYGNMQKPEVFKEYIYEPDRRYIAIGDRIKDIELASSCGLRSIGCLYGFGSEEELKGADILIHDISELKAAVDKLNAEFTA